MKFYLWVFNLIAILYLAACSSPISDNSPLNTALSKSNLDSTLQMLEKKQFVQVRINNMRVRQTPDLQGAIVAVLAMDNTVEYLHDSTSFETTIPYNQEKVTGRWYKVRTYKGEEGWIFGGFATFLNKEQNQKIIAQLKVAALENVNNPNLNTTAPNPREEVINQELLQQYKGFISRLSVQNVQSVSIAIAEYERLFANSGGGTCNVGFINFRMMYKQVKNHLLQQHNFSRYTSFSSEIKRYGRIHPNGDVFLESLHNNGFTLGIEDGAVVLREDVDFLARHFYRYVSSTMREYLNQFQLEYEMYWEEQQRLLVPIQKIADWAAFWANFADKYPNFILNGEARMYAFKYQKILLYGLLNTPSFDKNDHLQEDFKKAYEALIQKYPTTDFGERLQEYYQALKDSGFQKTMLVERAQRVFLGELE